MVFLGRQRSAETRPLGPLLSQWLRRCDLEQICVLQS